MGSSPGHVRHHMHVHNYPGLMHESRSPGVGYASVTRLELLSCHVLQQVAAMVLPMADL